MLGHLVCQCLLGFGRSGADRVPELLTRSVTRQATGTGVASASMTRPNCETRAAAAARALLKSTGIVACTSTPYAHRRIRDHRHRRRQQLPDQCRQQRDGDRDERWRQRRFARLSGRGQVGDAVGRWLQLCRGRSHHSHGRHILEPVICDAKWHRGRLSHSPVWRHLYGPPGQPGRARFHVRFRLRRDVHRRMEGTVGSRALATCVAETLSFARIGMSCAN
jgi:hypothetical protein